MSYAISSVSHNWLDEVVQGYYSDQAAMDLLSQLAASPDSRPPFSLIQGVIRYKNRLWLGSNKPMQLKIMTALHSSPLGGHSGAPATYSKIKALFFWPGMKFDIWAYVQSCAVCLQAKPDRSHYPGLLQPLPVPSTSWEVVSMDFIEGLPQFGSFNAILVVVDKFSKFSHFIPLRHPFTAASIAKIFMDQVYRLHGLSRAIVSDRDRIFTNNFWKSLFKAAGSEL